MEQQSQENLEERSRVEELYKVIKKSEINQQTITTEKSGETQIEETDKQNEQTMS